MEQAVRGTAAKVEEEAEANQVPVEAVGEVKVCFLNKKEYPSGYGFMNCTRFLFTALSLKSGYSPC